MIFDYEILKKDIEKIIGQKILFLSNIPCMSINDAQKIGEQYSSTTGVLFDNKGKYSWYVTVRG